MPAEALALETLATHEREPHVEIVHHVDARGAWATRGRHVLLRATGERGWTLAASFPRAVALDCARLTRPSARLLRADRSTVYATNRGALLGIRGGVVYRLNPSGAHALGTIRGDCLMNRAIAESADGSLYFGEYFTNRSRESVRIWRLPPDLSGIEIAFEIPGGRTRHVHAVHCDTDGRRLWVTLGDFAGECFLLTTSDGFRSVDWIGDGSQTFRCVGLGFADSHLTWLTDSHLEQNSVVTFERSSGRVTRHQPIASSAWYLAATSDGRWLATTTVEPGPAIQSSRASLLISDDGVSFRTAGSFAKDAMPMRFFKFGSLALPAGSFHSRDFWLSGEGLIGFDGASRRVGVEEP